MGICGGAQVKLRLGFLLLLIFLIRSFAAPGGFAQATKTLDNNDVLTMTKEGFAPGLIIKDIEASGSRFDTSPDALIVLKNAGVDQTVIEAMIGAQAQKPTSAVEAVNGGGPATGATVPADPARPVCNDVNGCLLREGTAVALKFASDLNSKTANEGDSVEFLLDEDLKVGDFIVVPKGAHAVATVSAAKKAGMLGRPGELSVQMQYVIAGSNHVRIRGTKGREGDSKTGATVALTVLFGPIGLIKHGKNVDIPAGTPLSAYVDQDIWLAATK